MTVVGVYLIGVPYPADKRYDYICPPALGPVGRGFLVTVPFGRGDRHRPAVVAAVEEREDTARLKSVFAVEEACYALTEEMFSLALFLREHTLCSFGDAVRALLPPALLTGNATAKIATVAEYRAAAEKLLDGLIDHCCDLNPDGPYCGLLTHCTAAYHDDNVGTHTNITYGDYFFVEALCKLKGVDPMLWI